MTKFLWTIIGLIITFVVFGIAFSQYSVHRAFPQTSGTIQIEGLTGPVEAVTRWASHTYTRIHPRI